MKDRIERSIVLPASRERVWKAITDPAEIVRWFGEYEEFPDGVKVGADIFFRWEGDELASRGIIEVVEPPHTFAYRWQPYKTDPTLPIHAGPSNLVTFTLEEVTGGTQLTVVETGFASLPKDRMQKAYQDNSSGWDHELNDLLNYVQSETHA